MPQRRASGPKRQPQDAFRTPNDAFRTAQWRLQGRFGPQRRSQNRLPEGSLVEVSWVLHLPTRPVAHKTNSIHWPKPPSFIEPSRPPSTTALIRGRPPTRGPKTAMPGSWSQDFSLWGRRRRSALNAALTKPRPTLGLVPLSHSSLAAPQGPCGYTTPTD